MHTYLESPFGELLVVANDAAITGLHWPKQKPRPHFPDQETRINFVDSELFTQLKRELGEYLDGKRRFFDIPLEPEGDAFSKKVWTILETIPYGETMTYGGIAELLGNKHLAQRVGQAVGGNPIGIVIPCHRVVGADGTLTGFAGGLETKHWLLELEEPEAITQNRLF